MGMVKRAGVRLVSLGDACPTISARSNMLAELESLVSSAPSDLHPPVPKSPIPVQCRLPTARPSVAFSEKSVNLPPDALRYARITTGWGGRLDNRAGNNGSPRKRRASVPPRARVDRLSPCARPYLHGPLQAPQSSEALPNTIIWHA
jgi:hypothetical protein